MNPADKKQQVTDAYRLLAKQHHPDKSGGDEDAMKALNILHDAAEEAWDPDTVEDAADVRADVDDSKTYADGYVPLILNGVEIPRVRAAELRAMPKSEYQQWLADRDACLRDQLELSRVIGLDLVRVPHKAMFEFFGCVEAGMTMAQFAKIPKRLCQLPRGTGKTFGIRVQAVYMILNFPQIRTCLLTGGEGLGKRQLGQVKNVFKRPTAEFLRLFPEFCLTSTQDKKGNWSDEEADFGNAHEFNVPARGNSIFPEPTFAISTAKAVKAGSHFTYIIIDDLVNDSNWNSAPLLEKGYQDYLDICPLLDPNGGAMLVTGTKYAALDTYERILANARETAKAGQPPTWAFLVRGCWSHDCQNPGCNHPEVFHQHDGVASACSLCDCTSHVVGGEQKCFFPAIKKTNGDFFGHTPEFLQSALAEYGKQFFGTQYLNSIEESGGFRTFTQELIDAATIDLAQMPGRAISNQYLCGDMAYSLGEDCDDTVIFAFAKPRGGGAHYIWACWWGKFTASDKTDLLLNAMKTVRPETMFMQKDMGSENFQLNLNARATLPHFNLVKVPITWTESGNHTKDAKLKRIADSELAMRGKRLIFAVSVINGVKEFQGTPGAYAKLCSQLLDFPATGRAHDDFADTASQVAAATSTGYLSEVLPTTRPAKSWLERLHDEANREPESEGANDGSIACF
jgi:hypothetical protein